MHAPPRTYAMQVLGTPAPAHARLLHRHAEEEAVSETEVEQA
jgi:hypothetical protein